MQSFGGQLLAVVVLATSITSQSKACDALGLSGFLPENDMYIGIHDKSANEMDEARFNKIIDRAEKVYVPLVKEAGGMLKVNRKWSDGTVNASAQRFFFSWQVNMYGGLARHKLVTDDAFALVLCHELGHHMGGAPKVAGVLQKWASVEGQADYYATTKCFRLIYAQEDNVEVVSKMKIPVEVKAKCEETYASPQEAALCMRMSMGGLALAQLLGELGHTGPVDFKTPDETVVTSVYEGHPKAQCRLDTYFQGSLCDKPADEKPDTHNSEVGYCNRSANETVGVRPLCWYKPRS